MNLFDQHFVESVSAACKRIASEPATPSAPPLRELYIKAIDNESDSCSRRALVEVELRGLNALQAARTGNVDRAVTEILIARRILAGTHCKSEFAVLMSKSMLEPQAAYLDYRLGNLTSALSRMGDAFIADRLLEERFWMKFLISHRINLCRHSARIFHDLGQVSLSRQFHVASLVFLETEDPTLLRGLPVPWREGWPSEESVEWAQQERALHEDLSNQLTGYVKSNVPPKEWIEMLGWVSAKESIRETQTSQWIRMRCALSCGQSIVESAIHLLRNNNVSRPFLLDCLQRIAFVIDQQL